MPSNPTPDPNQALYKTTKSTHVTGEDSAEAVVLVAALKKEVAHCIQTHPNHPNPNHPNPNHPNPSPCHPYPNPSPCHPNPSPNP